MRILSRFSQFGILNDYVYHTGFAPTFDCAEELKPAPNFIRNETLLMAVPIMPDYVDKARTGNRTIEFVFRPPFDLGTTAINNDGGRYDLEPLAGHEPCHSLTCNPHSWAHIPQKPKG